MAEKLIHARIQNPYDTVANWQQSTKILLAGELAFDETGKHKVGDGSHVWSELDYPAGSESGSGEENVQADWNETDTLSDSYIQNKPEKMPPTEHNHDDLYYTEAEIDVKLENKSNNTHEHTAEEVGADPVGSADAALEEAKEYADNTYTQATGYTNTKISELINGAPTTLDTLKEIADAMAANESVVEALDEAIGAKASQDELDGHTGNTTIHITATERTNWDSAKTHADFTHAPSNAEKNVIIGIQKNGTDITVDSATRKVNITVPTKISELANDSGYTTTDTKVTQNYSLTSSEFPVLMSAVSGVSTTASRGDATAIVNNKIYANPSSGRLSATLFNGPLNGKSTSTDKLATAIEIQTDLSSAVSASFDGSEDITPGVTGTLPIANGGTGATTATGALTNLGITATATELNYVDGVTSNIQAQLDAVDIRVTEVETHNNNQHQTLTEHAEGILSNAERISAVETHLSGIEEINNNQNTMITNLSGTVSDLSDSVDQHATNIEANSTNISSIDTRLTSAQSSISSLWAAATSDNTHLRKLDTRLGGLAFSYYSDYDITFTNGIGYASTQSFDAATYAQLRGVIVNGFGTSHCFVASITDAQPSACGVVIRCTSDATLNATEHISLIYLMAWAEN